MPGRKIQSTYVKATTTKSMTCMGDSLTRSPTYGVNESRLWPGQLAASLYSLGCPIQARNLGRAGDTTQQMVDRKAGITVFDNPALGTVWGGENDPGHSPPIDQATTQANLQTLIQTYLAAGTKMIVVVSAQYRNFSATFASTGDTVSTPYAPYASVRAAQLAAANSFSTSNPGQVAFCDLYAYMRSIIVAGFVVIDGVRTNVAQGDFSWHFADGNQHFNLFGNNIVRQAVLNTIQAQPGWIAALQAA